MFFRLPLVTLCGKKDVTVRRRRRKPKEDGEEENHSENDSDSDTEVQEPSSVPVTSVISDDDGIFTVTIGPTQTPTTHKQEKMQEHVFVPSARINPGLTVKHNVLYLYGGMFENGDRQYTFCDLYNLGMYITILYIYFISFCVYV